MKKEDITVGKEVKTTVTLLGIDVGARGTIKNPKGDVPFGTSGETVMVTFPNGGGLYYGFDEIEAA